MARILIVGGGCRGRQLASALAGAGHAVRISTRSEDARAAIEAAGAECWIGTPDRLATMRGALDAVSVLCWLLGTATGPEDELAALHSTRLEFFLTQAIDTTVRGIVYEAAGERPELLGAGAERVRELTARNAIPMAILASDPRETEPWLAEALDAISVLLAPG